MMANRFLSSQHYKIVNANKQPGENGVVDKSDENDTMVVAIYSRNEYFQSRFDPHRYSEHDKIAYFTYV